MRTSRRDFLRATLVSAGAIFAARCGDDEPSDDFDAARDTGNDVGVDTSPDVGHDTTSDARDTTFDTVDLLDGAAFFTLAVASGDPREQSVILWTRLEDEAAEGDLALELHLALDENFTQRVTLDGQPSRALTAESRFDRCVKARVTGLTADTTYFYRFVYTTAAGSFASPVGRTRTAPTADTDRAAYFAWVSCQDFGNGYYNPYKHLVRQDLDFVVHLGDYIYETDSDPSFQRQLEGRGVVFSRPDEAIVFNEGTDGEFRAARSLGNYRDLYKTYRSDVWLQRAHLRFPFVVIWDDHEFANDAWGANATASNGRESELDVERRKAANQAWFEYMPIDYLDDPDFVYDASIEFPGDIRIWRELRWGKHFHLFLTDTRSFRADHVVAENAVPGAIVVDEARLTDELGELPAWATPYIDDIVAFADGAYLDVLDANADRLGIDAAQLTGAFSAAWINAQLEKLAAEEIATPEPIAPDELPLGLAVAALGKRSGFTSIGTRYLAVAETWDVYARVRFADSAGESEQILGDEQQQWLIGGIEGSDATWKTWGNSYMLDTRIVDVTGFPSLPPDFKQRYFLSVEDWNGALNRRDEILDRIGAVDNVVSIAGDIHAFFVATPTSRTDASKRIVEFVSAAISSSTYEKILVNTAAEDEGLREAGASALALLVADLLVDPEIGANPTLAQAVINEHGYCTAEVDGAAFVVTQYGIGQAKGDEDLDQSVLDEEFTIRRFRTVAGSRAVEQDFGGVWKRWDPATLAWIENG